MADQIIDINTKKEVDSYPYGRLRCTAFFSVEFVRKKGFRSVFQTINPKNGVLNKEKKSTYYSFLYQVVNTENGHIETRTIDTNSFEGVNRASAFIAEHANELNLTQEMIKGICGDMFASVKIGAAWCGNKDAVIPLIDPTCKLLIHGFKTGENIFGQINLPIAEIEAIKKPVEFRSV